MTLDADVTEEGVRVYLDDDAWLDIPVANPVYRRLLERAVDT